MDEWRRCCSCYFQLKLAWLHRSPASAQDANDIGRQVCHRGGTRTHLHFRDRRKEKDFCRLLRRPSLRGQGILNDCKDYSGECSEITDITGVRDLTLAQRQEQPPLPDVAIPSEPERHRETASGNSVKR